MISLAHLQASIIGEETLAFVEIKSPSVNLHLTNVLVGFVIKASPLLNKFLRDLQNGFPYFVIMERNAFDVFEGIAFINNLYKLIKILLLLLLIIFSITFSRYIHPRCSISF